MLLYRLRKFRHYSPLEELFCELCLRKTNCFFASVILQHVCISQPNDSTIMLGHTQSHQHQCPLKQGHSDGMWWTRREIASDTKIYFLSIQRLYVNKNTLNVRFHWALQTVFCSYYAVWAKCSYFKSKSFKWITGLSRPLWGEKQCCTTEQATAGSLSQLLKVNWKQPPNLRLFKQEKADCLNSLRVSKRGGNNAAFFLTFH